MTKRNGKIQIEISRSREGCRWIWSVWFDDEPYASGVEGTLEKAADAALDVYEPKITVDHVEVMDLEAKISSLRAERDEWIYEAELARAERDKLREELRF